MDKIPKINNKIDAGSLSDRDEAIREVCAKLVPGWLKVDRSKMTVRVISGGITNNLFVVAVNDLSLNLQPMRALVRVYGLNTELIIDRQVECETFEYLGRLGIGPRLYGVFGNGRIEQFFEARTLEPSQMGEREPIDFLAMIATALAEFHDIDYPKKSPACFWSMIQRFKDEAVQVKFDESREPAKAAAHKGLRLHTVIDELYPSLKDMIPGPQNGEGKDFIARVRTPVEAKMLEFLFQVVFCHNDLLAGNILYVKGKGDSVQFIDFEYGAYNYRGFDLGNHFNEYAGLDFDLKKWYPSRVKQSEFLREYMNASSQGRAVLKLADNEEEWEKLMDFTIPWIKRFSFASNLFWGLWSVVQSRYSIVDFDFLEYASLRFGGLSIIS